MKTTYEYEGAGLSQRDIRESIVHENERPLTDKPTSRDNVHADIPRGLRIVTDHDYKSNALSLCHNCVHLSRDCSAIPLSLRKDRDQTIYTDSCRDYLKQEGDKFPMILEAGESWMTELEIDSLRYYLRSNPLTKSIHYPHLFKCSSCSILIKKGEGHICKLEKLDSSSLDLVQKDNDEDRMEAESLNLDDPLARGGKNV